MSFAESAKATPASLRALAAALCGLSKCCVVRYTVSMIKTFKHKGLRLFFETGSTKGIQAKHSEKLRMHLAALDTASEIDDLDIPGYHLHPLKGDRKGTWAISVSGNWRLTFEFSDGNVYLLNYEDYH